MPWEKRYDEANVLTLAMQAFWARGYEATSMSDLVAATGINRGSIYAAFTDKHTLFVQALKHYDRHHRSSFLTAIKKHHRARGAILAVFDSAIESAISGDKRCGCMLVNTALELSAHDPEVEDIVRDSLIALEHFFRSAIAEGQADGSVAANRDPVPTAQALLGLFLGLRVLSRARPEKPLLTALSTQASMLLD